MWKLINSTGKSISRHKKNCCFEGQTKTLVNENDIDVYCVLCVQLFAVSVHIE